jgi:hypothetical protein
MGLRFSGPKQYHGAAKENQANKGNGPSRARFAFYGSNIVEIGV